ncbi:MAG: DUF2155 domain-containing protein [Rhodospirillaceae bacterium]
MTRAAMAVVLAALGLGPLPAGAASGMIERNGAILHGLDKITARVSQVEVAIGQTVNFGTLLITLRACREAPPIDPPDAAAFMEIQDVKPDEDPEALFSGWMFASSPALSALEHPVYDVWVTGCRDSKP